MKHFFHVLLDHHMASLGTEIDILEIEKYLLRCSAHILIELLVFLLEFYELLIYFEN